ncbi:MAG TPA: KH domain-containing protein [bacterium]|nr:KH domain-containing protein [bacterium]
MREFIEYLIKQITSKPEEVEIIESNEEGVLLYKIHVSKEDMGTVIGKEGHTIKALRDLVRAKAIKDNVRVRLIVEENQ